MPPMACRAWYATTSTGIAPLPTGTMRSTGYSARPTTCATSRRRRIRVRSGKTASRRPEQPGPDLLNRTHAAKLHGALELARQDLERAARAGFAAGHHAEQRRAPHQHRLSAQRAGLEDIDATAHAAVEEHRHPAADGAHHIGQGFKARRGAVELPPAVV